MDNTRSNWTDPRPPRPHHNAIPQTKWEKLRDSHWPPINLKSKPMTDIEQILNQHRRKQRIIDCIVIACVMAVIGVVLCVG